MTDSAVITEHRGPDLAADVDACLTDLARLADSIRWAYHVGFGRGGYDPDAPRGTGSTPVFTDEELDATLIASPGQPGGADHVPASRFDIGIGDHGCRSAYQHTAARLAVVEHKASAAALIAGRRRLQPPMLRPTSDATLRTVLDTIDGIDWRLTRVRADLTDADDAARRAVRRLVRTIRRLIDQSVAELLTPLTRARRDPLPITPNCCRCGIRPQAERTRRRKGRVWVEPSEGGRCETCARYKRRHNGEERPTSIDERQVAEAKAAAARRRERGEGWGDA